MHYSAYAIVPAGTTRETAQEAVEPLMAPHVETYNDDETLTGFWDWWVIGGRWTGMLSGYDPQADPQNIQTCDLCKGTGTRPDAEQFGKDWVKWSGGCNGCMGTGSHVVWSTRFADHDGDVQHIASLESAREPYTLVYPEGVLHKETWTGTELLTDPDFAEKYRKIASQFAGWSVAVLDYHN